MITYLDMDIIRVSHNTPFFELSLVLLTTHAIWVKGGENLSLKPILLSLTLKFFCGLL